MIAGGALDALVEHGGAVVAGIGGVDPAGVDFAAIGGAFEVIKECRGWDGGGGRGAAGADGGGEGGEVDRCARLVDGGDFIDVVDVLIGAAID